MVNTSFQLTEDLGFRYLKDNIQHKDKNTLTGQISLNGFNVSFYNYMGFN